MPRVGSPVALVPFRRVKRTRLMRLWIAQDDWTIRRVALDTDEAPFPKMRQALLGHSLYQPSPTGADPAYDTMVLKTVKTVWATGTRGRWQHAAAWEDTPIFREFQADRTADGVVLSLYSIRRTDLDNPYHVVASVTAEMAKKWRADTQTGAQSRILAFDRTIREPTQILSCVMHGRTSRVTQLTVDRPELVIVPLAVGDRFLDRIPIPLQAQTVQVLARVMRGETVTRTRGFQARGVIRFGRTVFRPHTKTLIAMTAEAIPRPPDLDAVPNCCVEFEDCLQCALATRMPFRLASRRVVE